MQCGQKKCEKEAVEYIMWPGHDALPSCEEHVEAAKRFGRAMGFTVVSMPLDATAIPTLKET